MKLVSLNGHRHSWLAIAETMLLTILLVLATSRFGLVAIAVTSILASWQLFRTSNSNSATRAIFRKMAGWLDANRFASLVLSVSAIIILLVLLYLLGTWLFGDGEAPELVGNQTADIILSLGIAIVLVGATSVLGISVLLLMYVFLAAWLSRVFGVVVGLVLHPWQTFAAIPRNWSNQAFCIDLSVLPELVPGVDEDPALSDKFSIRGVLKAFPKLFSSLGEALADGFSSVRETGGVAAPMFIFFLAGVLLALIVVLIFVSCFAAYYCFALAARWSLKASVIVYLPFLFITRSLAFETREKFQQSIIDDSPARWAASLSLFLQYLATPVILAIGYTLIDSTNLEPVLQLVGSLYSTTIAIEWIDVFRTLAAILVFVVFFLALRDRSRNTDSGAKVFKWSRRIYLLRVICSLVTIFLTLRIVFGAVSIDEIIEFVLSTVGNLPKSIFAVWLDR